MAPSFQKQPIEILRNVIKIRRMRKSAAGDKDLINRTPLSNQEAMALAAIRRDMERKEIDTSGVEHGQAHALFQRLIDDFSEREILSIFIDPTLVLGVPYWWFIFNAIVSMGGFVATENFIFLLFLAPAMHLAGYGHYHITAKKQREKKINEIITEGLKI